MVGGNHPVEVVGRVRGHSDGRDDPSALQVQPNGHVRVRTDQGCCRDFTLDGVSVAKCENLKTFYAKYVQSRVEDIKGGAKCTIMMYGPTGSGKSHTMFGSSQEPGIAYLALEQLLWKDSEGPDELCSPMVKATVLEIYNEEIFDLLASNSVASPGPRSLKPAHLGRSRLDVRGKKVRNATSISGCDAHTLVREISKVERRRMVKSTSYNDNSSRSHCMVIIDVLAVGGRLLLVDMAGSENMEQAGLGVEAKLQTSKINQGNGALKRVVEAIANGDPYIPYRDSKLTMVLQDSFEDNRTKILMVLCVSPDLKDSHRTIATLEYGAKAKTIVRLPLSPAKENLRFGEETMMQAQLRSKDEYIKRLRSENEKIEREKGELEDLLLKQEIALAELRQKILVMETEKREQSEKILMLKCHDSMKQLCEQERLIKAQKEEIASLRLWAGKAESQLMQLQSFIKTRDKLKDITNTEVEAHPSMETAVAAGSNPENSLPEARLPESIFSRAIPGSPSVATVEAQREKVCDPEEDHSTVSRVLFAGSAEIDSPENSDGYDETSMSDGDDEMSTDGAGLCKTGWLPVIHEELHEEDDQEDESPRGASCNKLDCSPGLTSYHGTLCSRPVPIVTYQGGSEYGTPESQNGKLCSSPSVDKAICDTVTSGNTSVSTLVDPKTVTPHSTTDSTCVELGHHLTDGRMQYHANETQAKKDDVAKLGSLDLTSCNKSSFSEVINDNAPSCSVSNLKNSFPTVEPQSPLRKDPEISAAARRARIENIFLLCGENREIAARKNTNFCSPLKSMQPCNPQSLKSSKEKSNAEVQNGTPVRLHLEANSSCASPNHSTDASSNQSKAVHAPPTKHRLLTNPALGALPFRALENEMPTKSSGLGSINHSSNGHLKSKSPNTCKEESCGLDKPAKASSVTRSTVLQQLKGFSNVENVNWGIQGRTFLENA